MNRLFALLIIYMLISAPTVYACGPFFDQSYLLQGTREQLMAIPAGSFSFELQRLVENNPELTPEKKTETSTSNADLNDLKDALNKKQRYKDEYKQSVTAYESARERIAQFLSDNPITVHNTWYGDRFRRHEKGGKLKTEAIDAPHQFPQQLPDEFRLYMQGAFAYHKHDYTQAIRVWDELLQLEKDERFYKSTWAAFMIGKSYLSQRNAEKAIAYFKMVRQLKKEGFSDSLNLVYDSYGWQALAEYEAKRYAESIRHYLKQMDVISLNWLSSKVLHLDEEPFKAVMNDEIARNILLGWVVSQPRPEINKTIYKRMIRVMEEFYHEEAVMNADRISLILYNIGEVEDTERWLKLAKEDSLLTQWIEAKLLLREGQIEDGLVKLKKLLPFFKKNTSPYGWKVTQIQKQLNSEIGVLSLKRKDYLMAFDAFLKGKYWEDATYMAERVLTVEELEDYLNLHNDKVVWLKLPWFGTQRLEHATTYKALKHLMARRFAREDKWAKAIEYMPVEIKGAWLDEELSKKKQSDQWHYRLNAKDKVIELYSYIKKARDAEASYFGRSVAFYRAGLIMRKYGMELMGTELDPDWYMHNGHYDRGGAATRRVGYIDRDRIRENVRHWANDQESIDKYTTQMVERQETAFQNMQKNEGVLVGTKDEKKRVINSMAIPLKRFHYRYKASELMWNAAQLLKDNDELKAKALYKGGIFLKERDAKAADRFYKELVNSCGETNLGKAADRLRWFPKEFDATLYFPERNECGNTRKVVRQYAVDRQDATAVLRLLLKGPTKYDYVNGLPSYFERHPGATMHTKPLIHYFSDAHIQNGVAYVNFFDGAWEYLNSTSCYQKGLKSSIEKTLFEFIDVQDVKYVIDGEVLEDFDT